MITDPEITSDLGHGPCVKSLTLQYAKGRCVRREALHNRGPTPPRATARYTGIHTPLRDVRHHAALDTPQVGGETNAERKSGSPTIDIE